jgi:hypothetical protein
VKKQIKIIQRSCEKRSQSFDLQTYVKIGRTSFRVEIHNDFSYKSQSYSKVEKWDGKQWHFVCSLPFESLADINGYSRDPGQEFRKMSADLDKLLELAVTISK